VFCRLAAAAARFAAHRAFIAADSCARRSGVRLSFRFAILATLGSFTLPVPACANDFPLVLSAPAVASTSNFCFSLASFFAPFCRRASSRRILLLSFLGFIWGQYCSRRPRTRIADWISSLRRNLPMSPHCLFTKLCERFRLRMSLSSVFRERVVWIAIQPTLVRLGGRNHRMPAPPRMFARVSVR